MPALTIAKARTSHAKQRAGSGRRFAHGFRSWQLAGRQEQQRSTGSGCFRKAFGSREISKRPHRHSITSALGENSGMHIETFVESGSFDADVLREFWEESLSRLARVVEVRQLEELFDLTLDMNPETE